MLDEIEWSQIEPMQHDRSDRMKTLQEESGLDHDQSKVAAIEEVNEAVFQLTGYRHTAANAIWHHRRAMWGKICPGCGKPLRTPTAPKCYQCGTPSSQAKQ